MHQECPFFVKKEKRRKKEREKEKNEPCPTGNSLLILYYKIKYENDKVGFLTRYLSIIQNLIT